MDLVFVTRLRPIFQRVFSLLPAAFPLPISVLFLPFSLCLSSFFPSSKFCGLKVPKTLYLRTFRKTQIFKLGYRRRRLWKDTKRTLSYCAFVRILLVVVTNHLVSVFGWFGTRWRNWKLVGFYPKSLSCIFFLFSVCKDSNRF